MECEVLESELEPLTKRFVRFSVDANKFVNVPFVEKKFVVVAEVPVAFWKVKFWRVVEPNAKKLFPENA